MMLELMGQFFDARLENYEQHMLECIEDADKFYPFTADLLPEFDKAQILDLGCGTGLELDEYFKLNPHASVTGIDLAPGMLEALKRKHGDKNITLICGSYFVEEFGESIFDAAVSVESLHHFTSSQKLPLYEKLYNALKPGGYFILTDYFAKDDEYENHFRSEYLRLKSEQKLDDDKFYHYDTPLTVDHETEILYKAGFIQVEVLSNWGATFTIRATKA